MSTKANWPEGIKCQEPFLQNDDSGVYKEAICIIIDSLNAYSGFSVLLKSRIDFSRDMSEIEARARQICALPKMVELLKICCFAGSLNCDAAQKKIAKPAQDILREIGEVE